MSIFSAIKDAIFGGSAHAAGATPAATAPAGAGASPSPAATGTTPQPMAKVDVAANLDSLADKSKEDLDWRKSIVDLMKLLDLDSSLKARRALADELHYTGDKGDTATMNVWLHKQVMTKLAENGGVVPADLRD